MVSTAATAAPSLGGTGPGEYVVLGDSYSSGEGVEPAGFGGYFDGTDELGVNLCHRSSLAFGSLVAAQLESEGAISTGHWLMPACSGDEIINVTSSSQKDFTSHPLAQTDYLSPETKYVTVTIGGNDVGFGAIAEACLEDISASPPTWHSKDKSCAKELGDARTLLGGDLESRLVRLYREILRAAPNARLTVVTYPRLLPSDANYVGEFKDRKYCRVGQAPNSTVYGFRDTTVDALNAIAAELNQVTVRAVERLTASGYGNLPGRLSVARLDSGALGTHPFACGDSGSPEPYISGLRFALPNPEFSRGNKEALVSLASFHPNEAGHAAFAPVVREKLTPAAGLGATIDAEGTELAVGEALRVRVGTSERGFIVTAQNGNPEWLPSAKKLDAAARYEIGLSEFPASGVETTSFRSTDRQGVIGFHANAEGLFSYVVSIRDTYEHVNVPIDVEVVGDLAVEDGALSDGFVGRPYETAVTAQNAIGDVVWSAEGLPDGLSIDPDTGAITGVPTAPGTAIVTLSARDSEQGASGSRTLTVRPGLGTTGFAEGLEPASLSRNGRVLAYVRYRQLSGYPAWDVYARDTANFDLPPIHVSRSSDGSVTSGVQPFDAPAVSRTGRYVAFSSWQPLTAGESGSTPDIYVADIEEATLRRVPNSSGMRVAFVTHDGSAVVAVPAGAFSSWLNTFNPFGPVVKIDTATGASVRIDAAPDGTPANFGARFRGMAMTHDEQAFAFSSNASNLDPDDTSSIADIYVRDLAANTIEAVTAGVPDVAGTPTSFVREVSISDDRELVATIAGAGSETVVIDRNSGERLYRSGPDRVLLSGDGRSGLWTEVLARFACGNCTVQMHRAVYRGRVGRSPLSLVTVEDLGHVNPDGTPAYNTGSTPVASPVGISTDGRTVAWSADPTSAPAGLGFFGYFVNRAELTP